MKPDQLPPFLYAIWDQSHRIQSKETFTTLKNNWDSFVNTIQSEIPAINYASNEELLYLGELSPGCNLCRSGQWDCFFLNSKCNLNCSFCISPMNSSASFCGSNIGPSPKNNAAEYIKNDIQGISFSGGEPLLQREKLFQWLDESSQIPNIQCRWIYTNGLLLTEKLLLELSAHNLDEIRFNVAATNYQHPHLLSIMKKAGQILPTITIEIPVIPEDESALLKALPEWVNCGVKFLNFHELIYEPGSRSTQMIGQRMPITFPDGHQFWINPESSKTTKKIFQAIAQNNFPISLNYCSTIGKWRQLTQRREQLLNSQLESFEKYIGDGIIESIFHVTKDSYSPINHSNLPDLINQHPFDSFYRVQRMGNLTSNQSKNQWVAFEPIYEGF